MSSLRSLPTFPGGAETSAEEAIDAAFNDVTKRTWELQALAGAMDDPIEGVERLEEILGLVRALVEERYANLPDVDDPSTVQGTRH